MTARLTHHGLDPVTVGGARGMVAWCFTNINIYTKFLHALLLLLNIEINHQDFAFIAH